MIVYRYSKDGDGSGDVAVIRLKGGGGAERGWSLVTVVLGGGDPVVTWG